MACSKQADGANMSIKERAISWQARGAAMSQKADWLLVTEVMRVWPDQVAMAKTRFTDLGLITPAGDVRYPPGQDPNEQKKKRKGQHKPQEEDELTYDMEIHRNWRYWRQVPPRTIRIILRGIEPVVCGDWAMKSFIPRGSKEPPRERLLELLECAVDLHGGINVGSHRKVVSIVEDLCNVNIRNGRRLGEKTLPIKLPKEGVYFIESRGEGDIFASDRVTHIAVRVPNTSNEKIEVTSLSLESNLSRLQASISYPESMAHADVNVYHLFVMAGLASRLSGCQQNPPSQNSSPPTPPSAAPPAAIANPAPAQPADEGNSEQSPWKRSKATRKAQLAEEARALTICFEVGVGLHMEHADRQYVAPAPVVESSACAAGCAPMAAAKDVPQVWKVPDNWKNMSIVDLERSWVPPTQIEALAQAAPEVEEESDDNTNGIDIDEL